MADYNAIAGVTITLTNLLNDRMLYGLSPSQITSVPPDMYPSNVSGPWLNLYLYQVTENGSLKNQEIPGVGYPSDYGHPPLSLNLHYIITVHGTRPESEPGADLEAQRVLGDAMRVLHDFSIIRPDLLQIKNNPGTPVLDQSLRYEYERVKITLKPMSIEEFAKIWTAFPQSNFRRSVAYEVSVIQIESAAARSYVRPVAQRSISLIVTARPEVMSVYRTPLSPLDPINDPRARVTDSITIEGSNFTSSQTSVKIGAADPTVVVPVSDTKIEVNVPNDVLLQPGPQPVQVLTLPQWDNITGPPDNTAPQPDNVHSQESNAGVFTLVPTISGVTQQGGILTITGDRLYNNGLKTFIFIFNNSVNISIPVQQTDPPTQTPASIQAQLPGLQAGTYTVRVQVNGALNLKRDDASLTVP